MNPGAKAPGFVFTSTPPDGSSLCLIITTVAPSIPLMKFSSICGIAVVGRGLMT